MHKMLENPEKEQVIASSFQEYERRWLKDQAMAIMDHVVSCVGFGVAFFKVELKVLRCVFTF